MRTRTLGYAACAMLALAGCGRMGDSGWNPLGWMGGGSKPQTLTPEGGYPTSVDDGRQSVAHIAAARWQPLYEGRMLVVNGLAASKGWWEVALVTEVPMPPGRIHPDENGVLRLRLVGKPPEPNTFAAGRAPNPASDMLTAALTIPNAVLPQLREVIISGATNSVTIRP